MSMNDIETSILSVKWDDHLNKWAGRADVGGFSTYVDDEDRDYVLESLADNIGNYVNKLERKLERIERLAGI